MIDCIMSNICLPNGFLTSKLTNNCPSCKEIYYNLNMSRVVADMDISHLTIGSELTELKY